MIGNTARNHLPIKSPLDRYEFFYFFIYFFVIFVSAQMSLRLGPDPDQSPPIEDPWSSGTSVKTLVPTPMSASGLKSKMPNLYLLLKDIQE